jgi:hypothetical protein
VALVDDGLGVGDVVDGGHATVDDTDMFMHHLDHRCQTVGGAGGRAQQMVPGRIVQLIVDPVDDIECTLRRRRHDDLLHALVEVTPQGLRLPVMPACGLDHDVTV